MNYSTKMLRVLRADIGRNIHEARVRRKLVLAKLTRLSGVPKEKLDRYELGKNEIRLDELLRISCALDVPLARLLEGRWDGFFLREPRLTADFTRDQPPMQVRENL